MTDFRQAPEQADELKGEIMKRTFIKINLAGTIGLLLLFAGIGYASDLSIQSVAVTKASVGCTYQWQAEIKNTGPNAINGSLITAQGFQGNAAGNWEAAAGSGLGNLGPGQSVVKMHPFIKKAGSSQVKVTIYSQGSVLAEKIVGFPSEQPLSLAIENCTISDAGYGVDIRNVNPTWLSGINVQGSAASSADPNNWKAAPGMNVDCINGGGVYRYSGPKPRGYDVIKIQVRRGQLQIAEKVFSFAPASTGRNQSGNQAPSTFVPIQKVQPLQQMK